MFRLVASLTVALSLAASATHAQSSLGITGAALTFGTEDGAPLSGVFAESTLDVAITAYHGIVVGEAILGANVVRDLFAGITDILGGRSGAYEEELGKARRTALDEMEERATAKGANAVVGVDLDYEVINNMLMVSASGTAVTVDG